MPEHAASTPKIIVLTGAGMSAELGVPTYWTGDDPRYGSQTSAYGYTDFEHAQAGLWRKDPFMQATFFAQKTQQLAAIDPLTPGSPYTLLNELLAGHEHAVATSNPDAMFQRAGIAEGSLFEVHGSYRRAQCLAHPLHHGVFATHIVEGVLRCPVCGGLARPNVLFFDDPGFLDGVHGAQRNAFHAFLMRCNPANTLVIEIGAGAMVPTIRNMSLNLNRQYDLPVLRINPHDHEEPDFLSWIYPPNPTAPFTYMQATASAGLQQLLDAVHNG